MYFELVQPVHLNRTDVLIKEDSGDERTRYILTLTHIVAVDAFPPAARRQLFLDTCGRETKLSPCGKRKSLAATISLALSLLSPSSIDTSTTAMGKW